MSSLLFPTYKLNQKNTNPENMCDIVFEKAKVRGRTVNRASIYAEAAVFEKGVMKNFAEFTRKHLYRNSILVFSREFCEICKSTFFAE